VTGRQADDQWSLALLQRPGNGCGVGGAADVGGGVPHLRNEWPNDDSRCPAVGSRFSSAVRIPNPFRVQTWPAARRIGCRPRSDLARGGMPVIKHVLTIKEIVAASGVAISLVGLGGFAGVAAAKPLVDTGTYDEQMDVEQEDCWGEVSSPPAVFEVGDPESAGCEHSRTTE